MKHCVELVSTGDELLNGKTVNRHASVLGAASKSIGLELSRDTTVPDDIEIIREAVADALSRVDIVVVSGGLGPTCDDVTRDALAKLVAGRVVTDPGSVAALHEKFHRLGRPVTPQAELQARIVEGATVLSNSIGAAPGQLIRHGDKIIFVLPGPPSEFHAVLTEHVIPWLKENVGPLEVKPERILMLCGIGESAIMGRFESAGFAPERVRFAYSASPGQVEIRLMGESADRARVDAAAAEAKRLLDRFVFAEERIPMEEALGRMLRKAGATLATAESCTGGLLGNRITSVSGSSDYYPGGVIAYANEVKVRELGVDEKTLRKEGAVSSEVACAMASGVRRRFETDFGLGITGIAGPTGGTQDKPVGLVYVALADRETTWVKRLHLSGDRQRVKMWSTQMALDLLRRRLQGWLAKGEEP